MKNSNVRPKFMKTQIDSKKVPENAKNECFRLLWDGNLHDTIMLNKIRICMFLNVKFELPNISNVILLINQNYRKISKA